MDVQEDLVQKIRGASFVFSTNRDPDDYGKEYMSDAPDSQYPIDDSEVVRKIHHEEGRTFTHNTQLVARSLLLDIHSLLLATI